MRGKVLVVGPFGVIGRAIAERLAGNTNWDLATVSRRAALSPATAGSHITVDLLDRASSTLALSDLGDVTHVVYAAYTERPTMAATTSPNLAMFANVLDGLRSAGADLEHAVLIGGGKSYGEHLGRYKTPAKESDHRLLGPIFYNEQEDLLYEEAAAEGFGWTVLRPDVVIGLSVASPMNLLMCIAVYAALSKDAGVPLRFPGTSGAWTALHQVTDAGLLASATEWALTSTAADDEVFNVINGDQFRWQHLWDEIAAVFDMPSAAPQPMPLVEQMADKASAWDKLVETHALRPVPYDQIASWRFADGVWGSGFDMVQSTIKIRQAGFHDCVDSHESITTNLMRLREQRYVP